MFIDSYFYSDNMWISYADMAVNYNFAIQPITCYSPYHFNKDSARILKYPVLNTGFFEFMPTKKFIIFPTYCSQEFNIRWNHSLYEWVRVEVYSTTGVIYFEQDVSFSKGAYRVAIEDVPAGIYIVRVITDIGVEEQKITVYR